MANIAKKKRENLFHVLAVVPDDEPNQFFVLTQAEAESESQQYLTQKKGGAPSDRTGCREGRTFSGRFMENGGEVLKRVEQATEIAKAAMLNISLMVRDARRRRAPHLEDCA